MASNFEVEVIPHIKHYVTEEEYEELWAQRSFFDVLIEVLRQLWVTSQVFLVLWNCYFGIKLYKNV